MQERLRGALHQRQDLTHLALLPQGQVERARRALRMVRQMDAEGFGSCSWEGQCEAVCPKQIKVLNISRMVREFTRAALTGESS